MASGLTNPVVKGRPLRAVLFDLDGTLYDQARLRALMAMELLTLPLAGPLRAWGRWRALAAYRRAQEHLRTAAVSGQSIPSVQVAVAARAAGLAEADVERLVDEWMMRRPLKYLRWCRAAGVEALLNELQANEVRTGVLSDYPAESKIDALGLSGRMWPVLCSTDPDIGMLKPNARGFLRACEIWQLDPGDVLVVGDRPDVDAAGAAAAGMSCVIVGRAPQARPAAATHLALSSIEELRRVLAHGH